MKTKQIGFFDEENRLNKISKLRDPLDVLEKVIDRKMFRSVMNRACRKESTERTGRPPYDVMMMFKIIVLQLAYIFICSLFTIHAENGLTNSS